MAPETITVPRPQVSMCSSSNEGDAGGHAESATSAPRPKPNRPPASVPPIAPAGLIAARDDSPFTACTTAGAARPSAIAETATGTATFSSESETVATPTVPKIGRARYERPSVNAYDDDEDSESARA